MKTTGRIQTMALSDILPLSFSYEIGGISKMPAVIGRGKVGKVSLISQEEFLTASRRETILEVKVELGEYYKGE